MLEWSDIDIAVRDAVREFVDKEIRPHVDALESGEMEPYPIIRKLFATFGIADMARDSLNKRLARLREGDGTATAKPSSGGMFGGDSATAGMGFVVVSEWGAGESSLDGPYTGFESRTCHPGRKYSRL